MENGNIQSIYRGYPFDGVLTKREMPYRLPIVLGKDNRTGIEWKGEEFKDRFPVQHKAHMRAYSESEANGLQHYINFLLDRLFEYNSALNICEKQVEDMGTEYPFIPEDYGFIENEEIGKKIDVTGGVKWYTHSKNKGVGIATRREWVNKWILRIAGRQEQDVILENSRIAYAVFKALSVPIPMDEEFETFTVASMSDAEADVLNGIGTTMLAIEGGGSGDV